MPRFASMLCFAVLVLPSAAGAQSLCDGISLVGVKCQDGGGRQTAGGAGTGKVSHKGWPAVTGILTVLDHAGRTSTGTALNDELLGGHGDDTLTGGAGDDILWGDMWPTRNNTTQRDVLRGGAGNDFLYASHGRNRVVGGPGRDTIWAYFAVRVRILGGAGNDRIIAKHGRGTIDCGPGNDRVRVPLSGYRLISCERVRHFCRFGSDGDGRCLSPTGRPIGGRR